MSKLIKLPDSIYSPRQVLELKRNLSQLAEQLQRGDILDKLGLTGQGKADSARKLPPLLLELMRNSDTTIAITGDIQNLIESVEAMTHWPTLHLELATATDKSQKIELVHWFRGNLAPTLLFQFSFDPELIGGLIVRTPAREYDWSFRNRLLANAPNLKEVISHVG